MRTRFATPRARIRSFKSRIRSTKTRIRSRGVSVWWNVSPARWLVYLNPVPLALRLAWPRFSMLLGRSLAREKLFMSHGPRLIIMLIALGAAIVLLALQFQRLFEDRSVLPIDDFVEYWAAGKLNARGENPYDPDKLLPLQKNERDTDEAIMMWNPPWTLALAMPFGLLDARTAQLLWVGLGLAFLATGADLLWRINNGNPSQRWLAWMLVFTFLPTLFVLNAGQIGTWIFAGSVLFLYFQQRGWSMLAGAATVLLAIKPHLLYLFWIALIVWGICRDRRLLLGGLLAGLLASGVALACNPKVFQQYWEAMTQRPPVQWQSPTLGSLIRMAGGEGRFGLTFLPTAIGIAWLIWHAMRSCRGKWDWRDQLPILGLMSFVTASYGAWPFDLVILLPAVILVAVRIEQTHNRRLTVWAIGIWLILNGLALAINIAIQRQPFANDGVRISSFWFIWMAPAMLIAYLILTRFSRGPQASAMKRSLEARG